jgi:hypothetical protein
LPISYGVAASVTPSFLLTIEISGTA